MPDGKLDHYFAAALLDIARRLDTEVLAKSQIEKFLVESDHNFGNVPAVFLNQIFDNGGEYLTDQELVTMVEDDFGPTVYQLVAPIQHLELERFENSIGKMFIFGSEWIEEAIRNIQESDQIDLSESTSNSSKSEIESQWEPLKIDRTAEELEADLKLLDAELSKIEGDNGYADSAPEERNAILKPARGVWQAIKDGGIPSEEVIKNTLVKPFLYLAKKFADATIGIAAKNIAAWAFKLITGG